ncbi:MAG: hypothetical protein QW128_02585 [Thermoprotei archaeon]
MVRTDGLFKGKRDKGEDRSDLKKHRNAKEKDSRSSRRFANYLPNSEDSFRKDEGFEDNCLELLKVLAKLSSREAVLKFQLYQLLEEAKIETIRLSGIISLYEMVNKNDNDIKVFRSKLEELLSKYVKFVSSER